MESFDRRYPTFILKTLLRDRTTGRNIIWVDNEYEAPGEGYMGDDEITVEKVTGMNSGVIKPSISAIAGGRMPSRMCKARLSSSGFLVCILLPVLRLVLFATTCACGIPLALSSW